MLPRDITPTAFLSLAGRYRSGWMGHPVTLPSLTIHSGDTTPFHGYSVAAPGGGAACNFSHHIHRGLRLMANLWSCNISGWCSPPLFQCTGETRYVLKRISYNHSIAAHASGYSLQSMAYDGALHGCEMFLDCSGDGNKDSWEPASKTQQDGEALQAPPPLPSH